MKTVDSNGMRFINSSTIMKLIWNNPGISRADLSRTTGMSRSSVSEIVSSLISEQLVEEVGSGESKGGRKPRILKFNDNAHHIVSLDLGQRTSRLAVMNLKGRILQMETLPYGLMEEPAKTIDRLLQDIHRFLENHQFYLASLLGCGVALPCPVDLNSNQSISSVLFPHWSGFDLMASLQESLECHVYWDNDGNLGALAEHWWGPKKDHNLIYIAVSEGYGAGIIINGQIFHGRHGMAGEIGHMIIDASGGRWHRGIQGSLAGYVGESAILGRYKELADIYPGKKVQQSDLSIEAIALEARQGDHCALKTVDHLSHYLTIALANLVHLLDIDTIVIGGNITHFGELLFQNLRVKLREFSLWPDINKITIEPCSMGQNQIGIGAGTLILEKFLSGKLTDHYSKKMVDQLIH